jgi:hypothetical protein
MKYRAHFQGYAQSTGRDNLKAFSVNVIFCVAFATAMAPTAFGQSCPIRITAVDSHVVSAIKGSALRIGYQNVSPASIREIAFQVRFGQSEWATTVTKRQEVAVGKSESSQWDKVASLTPAAAPGAPANQITVWPEIVAFENGDVWQSDAASCTYQGYESTSVPVDISAKDAAGKSTTMAMRGSQAQAGLHNFVNRVQGWGLFVYKFWERFAHRA